MATYSQPNCSVASTLEITGQRWSLLIIRDAFYGVRRFEDFAKDLGIARNILSDRLSTLVEAGVMETRRYEDHPPRYEYVLTQMGKELFPVLVALMHWGDTWVHEGERPVLIHDDCGNETHAVPACAECGEVLTRRNVHVEPTLPVVAARRAAAR